MERTHTFKEKIEPGAEYVQYHYDSLIKKYILKIIFIANHLSFADQILNMYTRAIRDD